MLGCVLCTGVCARVYAYTGVCVCALGCVGMCNGVIVCVRIWCAQASPARPPLSWAPSHLRAGGWEMNSWPFYLSL